MSLIGSINRGYVRAWKIALTYFALIAIDVFFKSMGWAGACIAMLFLFIFLSLFILAQPSILIGVFGLTSMSEWSLRAGVDAAKMYLTKLLPSIVYMVMLIPLAIVFLPVGHYVALSALALVLYWTVELAKVRTGGETRAGMLRIGYWGILAYLMCAGLYFSPPGKKLVAESPAIQRILSRYNPFETSRGQAEYDATMAEVAKAREDAQASCFTKGRESLKASGQITDQVAIDALKEECDVSSGLVVDARNSSAVRVCMSRNLAEATAYDIKVDATLHIILDTLCKSDPTSIYQGFETYKHAQIK